MNNEKLLVKCTKEGFLSYRHPFLLHHGHEGKELIQLIFENSELTSQNTRCV